MPVNKISISVPTKSDERNFAKVAKAITDTHDNVLALLKTIAATDPMPSEIAKSSAKQQKISSGRAAELKDLLKSQKRGELHTNPGKLARLIEEINKDVATANGIEKSIDHERNRQFAVDVANMKDEIERALPRGVSAAMIGLPGKLREFEKKNTKEGWAHFSKNRRAFVDTCRDEGEDALRVKTMDGLKNARQFRLLKIKVREKMVDDGKSNPKMTPAQMEKDLAAALDKQAKPEKHRWASYLGLGAGGSYTLQQSGTFERMKIHLTMSKDSWTAAADGNVSVATNTVDQIYTKLLDTTGWKQLHATLEVPELKKSERPHVFLIAGVLGNDTKWENTRKTLNKDAKWVKAAQKALQDQLDLLEASLKRKLKAAKEKHGNIDR